jgi:hypothetical protein
MRCRTPALRPLLCLLAWTFAAPAIHAESLYVIEQLVVSVSSAPGGTGERIASIHSGDRVDVLERQSDEVHVRLANGTEGWVKASYLSSDQPLQRRLSERTSELERLKHDVSRLQSDLAAARIAASASAAANTSPDPSPASTSTRSADSPAATAPFRDVPLFMTPPDQPARPMWHWVLGSSVVMLGLGFLLGWQALDRRIRRKYGGLRIY